MRYYMPQTNADKTICALSPDGCQNFAYLVDYTVTLSFFMVVLALSAHSSNPDIKVSLVNEKNSPIFGKNNVYITNNCNHNLMIIGRLWLLMDRDPTRVMI